MIESGPKHMSIIDAFSVMKGTAEGKNVPSVPATVAIVPAKFALLLKMLFGGGFILFLFSFRVCSPLPVYA